MTTTNSEPCSICHVDHHEPGAPKCKAISSTDETKIVTPLPQREWLPFDATGELSPRLADPRRVLPSHLWVVRDLFAHHDAFPQQLEFRHNSDSFRHLVEVFTVMALCPHHRFALGVRQEAKDHFEAFLDWVPRAPLDLRPCPRDDGMWPLPNVAITSCVKP